MSSFRGKIFWVGVVSFVLGIIVFNNDFYKYLPYVFVLSFVLIILSFVFTNKTLILLGIAMFSLVLGIFRFNTVSDQRPSQSEMRSYQNSENTVYGRVVDVEEKHNGFRTTLKIEKIDENVFSIPVGVIVRHDFKPQALPGDDALFVGVLKAPESFKTDSGRIFDYPKYLNARGISFILDNASLDSFEINKNSFRRLLYSVRTKALFVFKNLSPSVSSLISGMTLGARESIPDELNDAMVATGTIHIVALSGFNVTLVSSVIILIFTTFLGKRRAYLPAGISIIIFVLLAGGGSPAVRAAVLATLYLLSQYLGNNFSISRAIAFAFCMMLFVNPFLISDLSFQLSFLATIGIIYVPPRIEKFFKWVPGFWKIRDIVLISISAQIAVLPLLVYETGILSIISIPINIIISPLVPLIMISGFVAMGLSIFGAIISLPIVFLTGLTTEILIFIIEKGSIFPASFVLVSEVGLSFVIFIYIFILWFLFRKKLGDNDL